MGERERRLIRVGIDVGGTHTKAVAIDNANHEIIGKCSVKTTHDDDMGVARGVITAFENCLSLSKIKPEDVVFIAHSTTQATNALLEGDVAKVGILGIGGGGLEGFLAKKQTHIDDIDLGTGRFIRFSHTYLKRSKVNHESVSNALDELTSQGAEVIVASMAFGVDDMQEERLVKHLAEGKGLPVSAASEISKLYGLTRRTRTAAINASILPTMLDTAHRTEEAVRSRKITVPLMIMRGDGGVMDISEMKKRPVLTMLSGPAASVVGALMYLRASNGIYFEVGGTSTNIGVIKNGRPAVDYTVVGGHKTYINSLDVRVLGVAGGSMIRISKLGKLVDVGPRSAHIGGLDYAVFTDVSEIEDPQVELFAPKEGDPADYVAIRLKNGRRVAITNSCAANVLGLVTPEYFAYGSRESAVKAMEPLAKWMNISVEELASQILAKAHEKIETVIYDLASKYKLEKNQMSLVGVGGGAAVLIPFSAKSMGLDFLIPQNAEIISSIGVALAMIRDVVERVIPNVSSADIAALRREAMDRAIRSGAVPDSVEVHIEIDPQTSRVTAIALGSSEVQAMDLLKACTHEEAMQLAAASLGCSLESLTEPVVSDRFFVFTAPGKKNPHHQQIRILDRKGFIKVQRGSGNVMKTKVDEAHACAAAIWEKTQVYMNESILFPDIYLCIGSKVVDFSGMQSLEQLCIVMQTEIADFPADEEILFVGARNIQ